MPKVVVFYSETCPYCERAARLLERKGADLEKILVHEQPERFGALRQHTGCADTVPQIVIGEHHVGGFDDLVELDLDGELDTLLSAD